MESSISLTIRQEAIMDPLHHSHDEEDAYSQRSSSLEEKREETGLPEEPDGYEPASPHTFFMGRGWSVFKEHDHHRDTDDPDLLYYTPPEETREDEVAERVLSGHEQPFEDHLRRVESHEVHSLLSPGASLDLSGHQEQDRARKVSNAACCCSGIFKSLFGKKTDTGGTTGNRILLELMQDGIHQHTDTVLVEDVHIPRNFITDANRVKMRINGEVVTRNSYKSIAVYRALANIHGIEPQGLQNLCNLLTQRGGNLMHSEYSRDKIVGKGWVMMHPSALEWNIVGLDDGNIKLTLFMHDCQIVDPNDPDDLLGPKLLSSVSMTREITFPLNELNRDLSGARELPDTVTVKDTFTRYEPWQPMPHEEGGSEKERVARFLTGPEEGRDSQTAGKELQRAEAIIRGRTKGSRKIRKTWVLTEGKTAFQHVVDSGTMSEDEKVKAIIVLLRSGLQVGNTDYMDRTLLHLAARGQSHSVVSQLIESGADVNSQSHYGHTPLHGATTKRDAEAAMILLEHGADPKLANRARKRPLEVLQTQYMSAKRKGQHTLYSDQEVAREFLQMAVVLGDEEIVAEIFVLYPDLKRITDSAGNTLMHMAVRSNQLLMIESLRENGVSIDVANRKGETPLHIAAKQGKDQFVRTLVGLRANLNLQDEERRTPMYLAVREGKFQCVRTLLQSPRVDLNLKSIHGKTPLYLVAEQGKFQWVEAFVRSGANPDLSDQNEQTPLYLAVARGDLPCVEKLLELRADPDLSAKNGKTPLHVAAERGYQEALQALIPHANINAKDNDGNTPLHLAARNGKKESVWHLLRSEEVNANARNKRDYTAAHLAVESDDYGALGFLIPKTFFEENEGLIRDRPGERTTILHTALKKEDPRAARMILAHVEVTWVLACGLQDANGKSALVIAQEKDANQQDADSEYFLRKLRGHTSAL